MKNIILIFASMILSFQFVMGQQARPTLDRISGDAAVRKSPMSSSYIKDGDAYVRVVYGQPQLKGRKMLGDKEPYGKVWRLGANEATELFSAKDIKFFRSSLPAGAYSVFAIPNEDSWTIIFNSELGQWGAYNYKEKNDVLRIEAPVKKAPKTFEAFHIWFDKDKPSMNFAWGDTWVSVPMEL